MKLISTAGIQMKWKCNHRSCKGNFKQLEILAPSSPPPTKKKNSGLQSSSNQLLIPVTGKDELDELVCSQHIAQLVEHCSANAEAMGANHVEEMNYFSAAKICNCLNCHYNCNDRISISSIFYIVLLLVREGK